LKCKILIDTCVLIAASTFYASDDLSIKLEHQFYKQADPLIRFIKENLSDRIGITTSTIERQSVPAFQNAIDLELEKTGIDRDNDFPNYSFIRNYCGEKLKKIVSYLVREPTDEEDVRANYGFVDKLYTEKADEAVKLGYLDPRYKKQTEQAAGRFRSVANWIYRRQQKQDDFQLTNLLKKRVETSDKWILSEAIYLSRLYNITDSEQVVFFLASTDHHFSPKRWPNGVISKQVTTAIKEKFDIFCDWPGQVESMAKDVLNGKYPSM
jgi:hypothetical protein